ncbi:hypothetical protein ACM26V_22975 [Salipaludibacillus sp. HK11]|uniref:hypothetical protein n=1 Tax=Salipaludibacillus sp. HK11 TaxID=3394320 RepID=UPI0039FC2936
MNKKMQLFKFKWHQFWIAWHETKFHYYGSTWHEKRMIKHEKKANHLFSMDVDTIKEQLDSTDEETPSSNKEETVSLDKIADTSATK